GADPGRLARAVDGGARLRHVLPQRHGRSLSGPRMADLRRPGARVGARHLGRAADRSEVAAVHGTRTDLSGGAMSTRRLTVAQALVRFLANQHTERDGERQRLIAGCW